jgi:hypothetical protein
VTQGRRLRDPLQGARWPRGASPLPLPPRLDQESLVLAEPLRHRAAVVEALRSRAVGAGWGVKGLVPGVALPLRLALVLVLVPGPRSLAQ